MDNVIDFPKGGIGDIAIRFEHTEEFNAIRDELSEFIAGLPLTAEKNDRLIELITKLLSQAGHDAIINGFGLGLDIASIP